MTKTNNDATSKDKISRIEVTFLPRPDIFLHDGHLRALDGRLPPHFTHVLEISVAIESFVLPSRPLVDPE